MEYIGTLVTSVIIIVVFYLAQIPAKRQEKELKQLQDALKENDRVITYSGLSGKIKEVLDDRIILSTEPKGLEISIEKWAVAGFDERNIYKDVDKEKEN